MHAGKTHRSVRELPSLPSDQAAKVKRAAMNPSSAPAEAAQEISPGVERWPVKTGTDADAAKVGVNKINREALGAGVVETTVAEMRALKRAPDMPPVKTIFPKNSVYQNHRAAPTETTIWKLTATVREAKLEQDGDYHLVLQDGNVTMIGEIPMPDPKFVAASSPFFNDIKSARASMDAKLKQLGKSLEPAGFSKDDMAPPSQPRRGPEKEPEEGMTALGVTAVITGVGFFDSDHNQDGVAPTAIEIHPILDIQFS